MPAIIRFLGYNPLPPGNTWAKRLVSCRTAMGITQGDVARRIGVDQATLARWERGEREPRGQFAVRAEQFVTDAEAAWSPAATRTA
jgi:transcriptional regulator with XRE-family HTH domain